jgi:hypothetical protein
MNNSPTKTIYFQFSHSPHTLNIVDYLEKCYEWIPIYFGGQDAEKYSTSVYDINQSCVIQDSTSIRKGMFDYSKIGKLIPIDREIIESLSQYIVNALSFQEDSTGWNFSIEERKRYFYDVLNYWNTVLLNLNPDVIVFFTRPHTPAEFPLYLLCKYHFKINIIYIDPYPYFNMHYHIISNSLEEPYSPFIDMYRSTDKLKPSKNLISYLQYMQNSESITPSYIRKVFDEKKLAIIQQASDAGMNIINGVRYLNLFKGGIYTYKVNRKPYYSLKSRASYFSGSYHHMRVAINNRIIERYYKKICNKVDFSEKYIYFSASYQPEATTSIMAGPFSDQFLVIDMLSYAIPDDWVIYYKEHPSIFLTSPGRKGSIARSKEYYNKLRKNAKIRLIPAEISSVKLIDNSIFVSTIGGTAGWESVVRGKPVLSFGNSWFHGCKSVFVARSLSDVKAALDRIINGFLPDKNDIERYAAALESMAVKGMIHRDFHKAISKCKNPKYEMERIGDALYKSYQRYYGNK